MKELTIKLPDFIFTVLKDYCEAKKENVNDLIGISLLNLLIAGGLSIDEIRKDPELMRLVEAALMIGKK